MSASKTDYSFETNCGNPDGLHAAVKKGEEKKGREYGTKRKSGNEKQENEHGNYR